MLNLEKVKEELNKWNFSYKNNIVPGHSTYKVKWVLPAGPVIVIASERATSYLFGFDEKGIHIFPVEGNWNILDCCLIEWKNITKFEMKKGILLENTMNITTNEMYQKRKMRKENREENSKKQDNLQQVNINWYPGHMAKTKREIKEKIDLIDIVFEVVDARIPYSSKNKEIEEMTKGKPRVIVMTKIDLCDNVKTNKWIKYYEDRDYIVVPIDLINNPNTKIIFDKIKPLIDEINNKRISKGLKPRRARILVMGVPNAGKSTLINRLVGKKSTNVGNRPGVTKTLEWIRINDKVELLDTPGILWPKLDDEEVAHNLASMTAIKEEVLDCEDIAIYIINKILSDYPDNIKDRYNITNTGDIVDILDQIGKKIGAFRNNETDYDRVYKRVIKDLQDGYLGKVTFDDIK